MCLNFAAVMKQGRWKIILTSAIFFLLTAPSFAANNFYFDYNARCKQAYESMISLRISEANLILQQELKEHPGNLIPVMIADYGDYLTLLFNGDVAEYNKRKGNLDVRIAQFEKGDTKSPWYRYCKANTYFHWAAVRIRFDENFQAGSEFRRSFLLIKENKRSFPNFKYNQLLSGLEEAIIGTVPDKYKWLANMLGMKGNVKSGTAQIVNFLNTRDESTSQLRQEAVVYYCFLKFFLLSERGAVWKYLKESNLDFSNNQVYAYMKSTLALNDNKASVAEQTLNARTQSAAYLNPPIFNYMLGNALLLKMDEDCVAAYQKFLAKYRGKMFVKDAYQKISLYYFAAGNTEQGNVYKNKIAASGNTLTDADKQAQRFAQTNAIPNIILLKARLYSDGGYFDKALAQLNAANILQFTNTADKLECAYRLGKIYQLMGQDAKAIPQFETAIQLGANRPEQFGARAALELGQIYENKGQTAKAIAYYQQCVNMHDHDFESSLEQKAKAGINRLGG